MVETKHQKFRRLAKLRGDRILKDILLLRNLSNRNNYDYTDEDIKKIFSTIEDELRMAKYSFAKTKKRGINL